MFDHLLIHTYYVVINEKGITSKSVEQFEFYLCASFIQINISPAENTLQFTKEAGTSAYLQRICACKLTQYYL